MDKVFYLLLFVSLSCLPSHSYCQEVNRDSKDVRIYILVQDDYGHYPLSDVKVIIEGKDTLTTNKVGLTGINIKLPAKGIKIEFLHPEYRTACAKLGVGNNLNNEKITTVFELTHLSMPSCFGSWNVCPEKLPKGITCKEGGCN